MTVSQLSRYLRGVFDDEELLHDVTLTGEVADISYSDRHTFLVLADGAYSVRCVHFSSRDQIEKGAKIAVRGSVNFYDRRNTVSFTYCEYFLEGVGDKNAKLTALKQKLQELGYFENRPLLPKYIVNVVAVTSPDGAAIRDFMRVVYDKCPFVNIRVYPVKVQGEGAAAQMARAIRRLQKCTTDAIVLCRGGGSDEDLDSFNDEELAIAVAQSKIPIISAVGHEINYSLCDFCAGTRAGTPSIAGEIVNSHALELIADVNGAAYAMQRAVLNRYASAVGKLNRLGRATTAAVQKRVVHGYSTVKLEMRRANYSVQKRLDTKLARLTNTVQLLKSGVGARFTAKKSESEKLKAILSALDPHRIIKIGYAAVLKGNKRVQTASMLKAGDSVQMIFSDGVATAVVSQTKVGD
ncbi:MAG: exodeoxyribonuclease VII large subunit [Clostridiales bacterium]|nr:exodeoxyribonuclease VII large subunit [Clostridiales bacterium]